MDYESFLQLIKSHNTTVYQVSKATGISASTFSDWKSGRSTPKADKLARALDICCFEEKKLTITGRDTGATCEEFGNYVMETLMAR